MKILIISQYFWPESFRINDLAAGLVERGHDVTVLAGIPNHPEGRFYPGYGIAGPYSQVINGTNVRRVPMVPRGSRKGFQLILNYLSFSALACLWAPLRCRERYDAIFVWCMSPVTVTLPGLVLKAFRGIPVYNWIADLWPDTLQATGTVSSGILLRWIDGLSRFIYRRCDMNLIASAGYRDRLIEMGVQPERIVHWPSWAEAVYAMPLERDKTVPFHDVSGFRVLYAGNIGSSQGFATILDAAEKLKDRADVHWLILGDGLLKPWVEREIETRGLGDVFHLLGRCPIEDVRYYAANADAMLVSLRKEPLFEITVPGKVQSCLAIGRPIIGSIDGEAAQIIRESGAGYVAPADDADRLADAVLEMSCLPREERNRMGRAAREYFFRNFEREMLLSRLERLLRVEPETPSPGEIHAERS